MYFKKLVGIGEWLTKPNKMLEGCLQREWQHFYMVHFMQAAETWDMSQK